MSLNYVIGVDFGSDSVRAIVTDAAGGASAGEGQAEYPRWAAGEYQRPNAQVFRQHPLDYVESFTKAVSAALDNAGVAARVRVVGIACAATGSTPCPVDRTGTPLALLDAFTNNENAMFHLWKDHSAIAEAKELNLALAAREGVDYTRYQGAYSSEWFWAKILRSVRLDERVRMAASSWIEHSDWMPALLTGRIAPGILYRNACAAGHKALWHSAWNGLPDPARLAGLDGYLACVADTFLPPGPADTRVGILTPYWAEKLNLPRTVIVGGSSLDSHAGGVGAGIGSGVMVSSLGTSSVNLLVGEAASLKPEKLTHVCGTAENSIIPGLTGIESGQAAFGDVYGWFAGLLLWPLENLPTAAAFEKQRAAMAGSLKEDILPLLAEQASKLEVPDRLRCVDWLNGRRYPNPEEDACGAVTGLTLGTTAPEIFRSLALATVFGQRRIFEGLRAGGVDINQVIAVGGIARKSPYIMQMMADALRCPIGVCSSRQPVARGAAIYAASAAGVYPDIPTAQKSMCEGLQTTYSPISDNAAQYDRMYSDYRRLGEFMELIRRQP